MQQTKPEDLFIIDLETVPQYQSYELLNDEWKNLWEEKVIRTVPENMTASAFYPLRAGIMAEFGKIICISIGYINRDDTSQLRIRSFYGDDEKKLLTGFMETIDKIRDFNRQWCFAGHNIKEFDIPFICRRILINGMTLPNYLDFQHKKPWETNLIDTFQYWRFGDFKNYTSLKLLAATMGLPSPKEEIDGSMISDLYWVKNEEEKIQNLKKIMEYCQKDVVTTVNLIMRFKNLPLIQPEAVVYVDL